MESTSGSANKPAPLIQKGVTLAPYTSWVIGGRAEYLSLPQTTEELSQLLKYAQSEKLPVTLLGGGSNVLISDEGIPGLVICLRKLTGYQTLQSEDNRFHIYAMAGTAKSELLKLFLKMQLAPSLFLAGIPGDVGGGVVMNAGVGEMITPREFVEIVDWVDVMDLSGENIRRLRKSELTWSYRHCHGWEPGIIVQVGMSWPIEKNNDLLMKVKAANQVRLTKQPLHLPSCGSVFVNPPGHKAGQLIDQAGLRGYQIGEAQVSEKHANFIVNLGKAKAMDVHLLIEHVKSEVFRKSGIQLNTEVRYLGAWPQLGKSVASS